MSQMDVTAALLDPYIADRFTVKRRAETISDKGRTQMATTNLLAVGVIASAGPNDLMRLDDSQRMGRVLSVVTRFRLIGPAPGKQPDIISWQGDDYIVITVDPYPQYGQGFVQAIIGSVNVTDQPTPG